MNIENNNRHPLVCFFDSGIGGINLLYECSLILPECNFIYYADNYNVPYGNRTGEQILKFVLPYFEEMAARRPEAAVVACNTVTAQCISMLRKKYKFEIIGIQPAIKPAVAVGGKCLVLATTATVNSSAFVNLVERFGNNRTEVVACPDLADYIENNIFAFSEQKIRSLLPKIYADSVVLGCTHYVFVKGVIQKFYGCPVFDGISGTADHLRAVLGIGDHRYSGDGFVERVNVNKSFSYDGITEQENGQKCGKISFIGGDSEKNAEVFELVRKNAF